MFQDPDKFEDDLNTLCRQVGDLNLFLGYEAVATMFVADGFITFVLPDGTHRSIVPDERI